MTPQPKTCGECRPIVSGAIGVCIELCPRHASAEALYEAAKAVMADTEIAINMKRKTRWALRDAIDAYEGK